MSVSYFEIHKKVRWTDGQRDNRKTRWRCVNVDEST